MPKIVGSPDLPEFQESWLAIREKASAIVKRVVFAAGEHESAPMVYAFILLWMEATKNAAVERPMDWGIQLDMLEAIVRFEMKQRRPLVVEIY